MHPLIPLRPSIQAHDDTLEQVLANVDPTTWSEATVLQLCDELKTFILAGHETTAAMMTWCTYELAVRPDLLAKVRFSLVRLSLHV